MSEKKDTTLLAIRNLHAVYQTQEGIVQAVNGIDLEMKRGETLGLVGETGAGKTTTALSIMRLLPERTGKIVSGEIEYNGTQLLKLKAGDMRRIRGKKISMIFQDPMTSLNPVITVGDQISEVLMLHQYGDRSNEKIQMRVEEMMELVGIPARRKNEYPHQFSGGMRQRIVIAIAIACEPELLIADEPTTALDVTIQAQVLEMMAELKKRLQTSMILITHDLGVVAQNCDNVGIIYAGKIIEYGTIEDIFKGQEHHPYTVGLFNSIPDLSIEGRHLNTIPGLMPDPTKLPKKGCSFQSRCSHCMDICRQEAPADYVNATQKIKCHLYKK
jgi:peptide/nickel transport system ATP-binding protein